MKVAHKVLVAAVSDIGCVRTNNEDSFGYDPAHGVYVVCDGMGGMAAGEVASQTSVATFLQTVAASNPSMPAESLLSQAIRAANHAVHQAGLDPALKGMGTTLVAACLRDLDLCIGNVGDSRAYHIQNHQCTQITIDHSYLNELIRAGIVDVKDAATVDVQGMQTVITRAIGVEDTVDPDFFSIHLAPNDIILLASDGLTRYLDINELSLLVGSCDLDTSARNMINIAKERGGADNITVLLLQVVAEEKAMAETPAQATPAAEPEPQPVHRQAPAPAETPVPVEATAPEGAPSFESLLDAEPEPVFEPVPDVEPTTAIEEKPVAEEAPTFESLLDAEPVSAFEPVPPVPATGAVELEQVTVPHHATEEEVIGNS